MANKPDTATRALLDALCEWVVNDLNFMPVAAAKLRERFEAATTSRGVFQRDRRDSNEITAQQKP